MLKKRLGAEAIEKEGLWGVNVIGLYYKIPSTLIIPEGCVEIGYAAFWKCIRLKKVIIPKSLKRIGDYSFRNCSGLEEVVIPENVEEIGDCAFYRCSNATIILEKLVSEFEFIESSAFYLCKNVVC